MKSKAYQIQFYPGSRCSVVYPTRQEAEDTFNRLRDDTPFPSLADMKVVEVDVEDVDPDPANLPPQVEYRIQWFKSSVGHGSAFKTPHEALSYLKACREAVAKTGGNFPDLRVVAVTDAQ